LTGVVKSTKMNRTIVMRMDYLHFIKKYQRYEKRHTNISAHISPCFRCNEGDKVVVGQCRPLSKTQGDPERFQGGQGFRCALSVFREG
jgi:small subunit ribosomal protein S11e